MIFSSSIVSSFLRMSFEEYGRSPWNITTEEPEKSSNIIIHKTIPKKKKKCLQRIFHEIVITSTKLNPETTHIFLSKILVKKATPETH